MKKNVTNIYGYYSFKYKFGYTQFYMRKESVSFAMSTDESTRIIICKEYDMVD